MPPKQAGAPSLTRLYLRYLKFASVLLLTFDVAFIISIVKVYLSPMDFNWELCADLHNNLVRRGWEAAGQDWSTSPFRSFWDAHPDKHEALSRFAHPKIILFWKRALEIVDSEYPESYNYFFYYIGGLAFPESEINQGQCEIVNVEADAENRYIKLYEAASMESHPAGIIMDQETGKVIMQMSIWSSDWHDSRLQWQPLEKLLIEYDDMINMGKVVAKNFRLPDAMPEDGPDVHDPWLVQSYSAEILARTLEAYKSLILAIEERMPPSDEVENPGCLADNAMLDEDDVRQGAFARAFLTSAPRSEKRNLRFVAPGIEIPTEDTMRHQPFHNIRRPFPNYGPPGEPFEEDKAPYIPFLLFPATKEEPRPSTKFDWPFDELESVPSGLWLEPVDPSSWGCHEDATTLRLPFEIGGQGHVRHNDNVGFENPSKTALYQPFFNPFITGHSTQLFLILENWAGMVRDGHWQVDERGVAGGIEKFAEADSSDEVALRYTVPIQW